MPLIDVILTFIPCVKVVFSERSSASATTPFILKSETGKPGIEPFSLNALKTILVPTGILPCETPAAPAIRI